MPVAVERLRLCSGVTGAVPVVAYDGTTAKASLSGINTFTCTTPSGGKKATLTVTIPSA